MRIDRLDHSVLTVADLGKTITFYTEVLGMDLVTFGEGRQALTFGRNKINLHEADHPFSPHAASPVPRIAPCRVTAITAYCEHEG